MPTSKPSIPVPPGATQRLAALHIDELPQLLPEGDLADLARLAAIVTGARVAVVRFRDADRPWSISRLQAAEACLTDYLTFCERTELASIDPVVIPDTLMHPGFRDHRGVVDGARIRFFARVALRTLEGPVIGDLCVLSPDPCSQSFAELTSGLGLIARQIIRIRELHNENAGLRRRNEIMSQFRDEFEQYGAHLRRANEELRQQSFIDGLTGVHNRRAFDLHLGTAVSNAAIQGSELSLLMLDVDHFKRFNDRFGHLIGDDVLRHIARRIQSAIRTADTVARFGGEEFAVILPGSGRTTALHIAETIRTMVRTADYGSDAVTISIGVSTLAAGGSGGDLLAAADQALYCAKRGGRDRVCSHTEAGHS